MEDSKIFSLPRFKTAAIVVSVLSLIYLLVCLLVIGGDDFVIAMVDILTIPLAITTALFALSLWNMVKTSNISRALSINLFIGWVLWAIGEVLWAVNRYSRQEVPYPSPADFFWLIGYIPLGVGLYLRLKELPVKPNARQKMILSVVSLVVILLTTVFVIIPIIQNNDHSRWIESALNVIYSLADLFILLLVLRLLFIYRGGDYGLIWNLIIVGFVLHSLSNLIFSYANSINIYYPDNKVNFLSSIVIDAPYNFSYALWILSFYALRLTINRQSSLKTFVQPDPIPNTHVLIFTKGDDTVIQTSNNFWAIFDAEQVEGKHLAELLQIPEAEAQFVNNKIHQEGKIADYPVLVKDKLGVEREAFLSGIAIANTQKDYSGCILLLRLLVEANYALDQSLTSYQRLMVRQVQQNSGSHEEAEIRKLLLDYYLTHLVSLQNMVFRTGGAQLSLVFLEYLQHTTEHPWRLQFNPQTILTYADYPLKVLREELPMLLDVAKRFAAQLTDSQSVEAEMQDVVSQIGEAVNKNVAYHLQANTDQPE